MSIWKFESYKYEIGDSADLAFQRQSAYIFHAILQPKDLSQEIIMKRYCFLLVTLLMLTTGSYTSAQHLTSAKLYLKYNQFQEAEASAIKAVEKDPDDEEAWFVLGQARYMLKKYPQMVEAFDKAVAIDPEEHKSEIRNYRLKVWADSYNSGVGMYNRGRDSSVFFQSAIKAFQNAIVSMPDSLQTYYVCALAYYGNNQIDEAIKVLETSLKKNSNQVDELNLLGKVHLRLAQEKTEAKDEVGSNQEYRAAQTAFERIFQLDRSNIENIKNLMGTYEQLGEADKALALTRDALVTDPSNRTLRYAYGVYLLKQEKFDESIAELKKVLDGVSGGTEELTKDATYNLGVAFLNWGVALKAEADKKAEEALKAKKGGKEVKEDLSYKEKFRDALPYLEKSVEGRRDDVNLWQQLGRMYGNLNMMDKMKKAFAVVDSLTKGN